MVSPMNTLFNAIRRSSGTILLFSILLSIFGAYYTVHLYKNLRTDIQELLPETAPSVLDLKKGGARFSSLNHIEVVIESQDFEIGKKFQLDVARELEKLPKDLVSEVKVGIAPERAFFTKYRSFYLSLEDWKDLREGVKAKIKGAAKSAFDLGLGDDEPAQGPDLDATLKRIKEKAGKGSSMLDRFPDNLFIDKEGKTRVVIALLNGMATSADANARLSEATEEIVKKLNPASYGPGLRVGLGGDVQNVVEEQRELVKDLIASFIVVFVLVAIILCVYFLSWRAMMLLSVITIVGTAMAFGMAYFAVGYLNANTAFLGSIVLGNGINFPIILLARYAEMRRAGNEVDFSLSHAMEDTWKPTLTAALAAGLSYLSLALTDFRGFSQFGIIGGLGMVVCWSVSYLTMPAAVFWLEKRNALRLQRRAMKHGPLTYIAPWIARNATGLGVVTIVLVAFAAVGATHIGKDTMESDLSKLRNKWSMEHGSGYWGKRTDHILGANITPTAVLTENEESTRLLRKAIDKVVAREIAAGRPSPFASIGTVDDIYPEQQAEKVAVMKEIRALLTPAVMKKLDAKDRELVSQYLPANLPQPFERKELPPALLRSFQESNGKIGTILHVYPRLGDEEGQLAGTWNGEEVIRYTRLLREAITESGQPAVIVGQNPVSADMLEAINKDGPVATFFAFAAVALLVIALFPSPRQFPLILISLGIGVFWMAGAIGWLHWKINFLNFIALPITFGIGVDYGVNMFGRLFGDQKKYGHADVAQVIRETGGAVLLCSCTTIIGYGSLLLSGSQAFVSFGKLAVTGEIACVFAALFCLPSFWQWARVRDKKVSQ